MSSPEQMWGQNPSVDKDKEARNEQKYAVVDPVTGLVETYDTPEEAADAKVRMQDPEYRK